MEETRCLAPVILLPTTGRSATKRTIRALAANELAKKPIVRIFWCCKKMQIKESAGNPWLCKELCRGRHVYGTDCKGRDMSLQKRDRRCDCSKINMEKWSCWSDLVTNRYFLFVYERWIRPLWTGRKWQELPDFPISDTTLPSCESILIHYQVQAGHAGTWVTAGNILMQTVMTGWIWFPIKTGKHLIVTYDFLQDHENAKSDTKSQFLSVLCGYWTNWKQETDLIPDKSH